MEDVALGTFTLEPRRQLVAGDGRVPLGKRALDIISVLAEANGKIVTKDELLDAVWPGVTVEENALQVHIVALRKALGPEAKRLKTIRGVGYQLDLGNGAADTPALAAAAASQHQPGVSHRVTPEPSARPRAALGRVWPKGRATRIALALAAFLTILVGTWLAFGSELGLRAHERIPIVVRQLTATTSADASESALARGLTDELIIRLRRSPQLRIGTANPDGSISGDAFKKAYVVDGSIRRSGGSLRVTARLFGTDGEVLWPQTFDRPLAEIFAVQEQIAAAIGGALRVSLDIGTDSRSYGGTDNPEAYAAYVQGYAHMLDPDYTVAERYLKTAIALDPHYVKAFTALSVLYGVRVERAPTAEQGRQLLHASTQKAITANPELGAGYQARAWYYWHRRDLLAADRSMRRTIDLNTLHDPVVESELVPFSMFLGRTRKGMELSEAAETIDPIFRNEPFRIWGLVDERKYQEAIDQFDHLQAIGQGGPNPAESTFWAHLLLHGEADASQFAKQHQVEISDLLAMSADPGLPKMSLDQLRDWATQKFGDGHPDQLAFMAVLAGYRHQPQLALRMLQLAFERPGGFAISLFWNPALADVRRTPQFKKFLIDYNVAAAWRESGDWGDYCRPTSSTDFACT